MYNACNILEPGGGENPARASHRQGSRAQCSVKNVAILLSSDLRE